MSADFWAGYISGATGILIGNPLDLLKVRLQAGTPLIAAASAAATPISASSYTGHFSSAGSLIRGTTAPILGYGALNALLFMTYNRTTMLLHPSSDPNASPSSTSSAATPVPLWTTFIAGAIGGLATWLVSTPTELVKCRAQVSSSSSSVQIARDVMRTQGLRGLYFGGTVTALRDSIGYGFYFWSYELGTRRLAERGWGVDRESGGEAAKVLFCGGVAGVVTWASIFPLDVVKTRVQTQVLTGLETVQLLGVAARPSIGLGAVVERPIIGAWEMTQKMYSAEGAAVFFRGLTVCSVRAFVVNAAQWAVYEWIMRQLDPSWKAKENAFL